MTARTYPLHDDDAWWQGRCRTCRHHGADGACLREGEVETQAGRVVPLLATPDALRAKCWEAAQ